jgi:cytochrome c-type biogenesis protein CcmH
MRSWTWPLAAALLLAAAGLVAVTSLGSTAPPTRAEQAARLAGELRCPDCQGLSVAESQTAAARAIRAEIVTQLEGGRSPDEVRRSFVDRYGDWILLRPSAPWAWLVPLLVIGGVLVAVATWILRGGRRAVHGPDEAVAGTAALDDTTRRRLDEETEALDA